MSVDHRRRFHATCSVILLGLGLAAASQAADPSPIAAPAADRLRHAGSETANWLTHGRTYDEQRFSPLDQINSGNVQDLGLTWFYDLDTNRGQESTPLVVDGVLYATTAWSKVVALDAATGKPLWSYDPKVPGSFGYKACCDVVNRGAAYDDGRIFFGTVDGRLIALDAKTGALLWSVVTVDQSKPYTISGAPQVFHGKVVIGNGGADYGVRGYVTAYDQSSGRPLWRFYLVPGDPHKKDHAVSDEVLERLARPTWFGSDYVRSGGGGTAWDALVYDPELNQLYIGVGNGSPDNRRMRSLDQGDNLFLGSIVALDPDSGKYLWHYQETPGETWDFTSTAPMILSTQNIGGVDHKVIFHAPKNGFFYVIDRIDGKLLSAEKFAPANWADHIDLSTGRPVETPGARYKDKAFLATVAGAGAHSWQPMAFSPKTNLVYLPVQLLPSLYEDQKPFTFHPGRWNLGYDLMTLPLPSDKATRQQIVAGLKGWLSAWDPVAQREVWRADHGGPWNGGVLATSGDLVFQGTANATFEAYDAAKGGKLWSFETQSGVMAGPVAYSVAGQQYIAVLVGSGGAVPLALPAFGGPEPQPNGRVMAFKLGGRASLPPFSPVIPQPNPPSTSAGARQIERGRILYGENCAACHGVGTWSSGVLPDFRRSAALTDGNAWEKIVLQGALQARGMVSFKAFLTASNIEDIRSYVGSEAQALVSDRSQP